MVEKCFICNKKLKLAQVATGKCKCELLFCGLHIHNHNCQYNFKKNNQDNLTKNMQVIEQRKVNAI